MTRAVLVVLALALGSCVTAVEPASYRDANFDYFVAGDPSLPRAPHTQLLLALMGGGGYVDFAYAALARHAGGGHIVILRVVAEDSDDHDPVGYGEWFMGKWGPVTSAETIVFHHRAAAYDPRVLAVLRGADGIFLAGGDQGNYIRDWKGTPVQALLNEHVRKNRPIGGSSAGLAILGHYSYTSLDGGSMESKAALTDPFNSGVTLEDDFLHARYLQDVITDTHFSTRSRLGRLIVFTARLRQSHPHANIFGVGVDQQSALLVDVTGVGRLAPGSKGSAWCVLPQQPARVLTPGQPLSIDGLRIVRIDQEGSVNFITHQPERPGAEATESIQAGKLTRESIASPILSRDIVPPDES